MTKYPGMCVARPEVLRVPHESVLWHGEVLLPGPIGNVHMHFAYQESRSRKPRTVLSLGYFEFTHETDLIWSCGLWLSGFFFIALSLYATQRLPSYKDHTRTSKHATVDFSSPSIIIFTAPKPFKGSTGMRQTQAVKSWLALSPYVTVAFFYCQDPSASSFADAFDSRVLVDTNIDFT
ncbi:hypothetical protein Fmac_028013 [Flemingia macrophylla]|uniref:Glycosyltransferase family 92 protein n=1 Tax=Flemingia macrophylla TaxID=520843 RepID=A0ABD1LJF8_9FABA